MNELNQACERLSKATSAIIERLVAVTHEVPPAPGEVACNPPDSLLAPHANLLRNLQRSINADASHLEALHRSIEL